MRDKKNLFGITHPDKCYSKIWRYHSGHSRLLLKIDQNASDQEPIYVTFFGVLYFEGPVICTGGKFWLAEDNELLEMLLKIKLSGVENQQVQQEYLKTYNLVIGGTSTKIKILSSVYQVQKEIPRTDFPDV